MSLKLSSGKSDLQRHMKSAKHLEKEKLVSKSKNIADCFHANTNLQNNVTKAELKMCALIVEHDIAILTADHMGKFFKSAFPDSKIASDVKCGRTKATALIQNVLGKEQFNSLCDILNKNKFSICVDESTDVSCNKVLSVVARVCKNFKTNDFHLCILEVENSTSHFLYNAIKSFFENHNINYKDNMIGFAADGANNMTGINNSLASLMKRDIPNLVIFKCMCHSIALCSSYACTKLPSEVENLVRNIYNYISNSPKRHNQLQQIMKLLEYKPLKILHPCQTRWLSLESVVNRIIELYEPLKIYFSFASEIDEIDNSKTININLNSINLFYLNFLSYILNITNAVNKYFQKEATQIAYIYDYMKRLYCTILSNFVKPEYLNSEEIYEYNFQNESTHLQFKDIYIGIEAKKILNSLNAIDSVEVIKNCISFYIELCTQIRDRFDFQNPLFVQLSFLNPRNIFKKKVISIDELSCLFPNLISLESQQLIDNEFRLLRTLDLSLYFKEDEINSISTEDFWKEISVIDQGSSKAFSKLCEFVQNLFCLPVSSANVERIFSIINANKTKKRNRMSNNLLSAILHTKDLLKNCKCYEFEAEQHLINKCTSVIY